MTASKGEQILAAVIAAITPTAGVASRVYRDRYEAVSRGEMPALVVLPADEEQQETVLQFLDTTLNITVDIIINGAPLSTLADPVRVSMHQLLMADRTLGGLAHSIDPNGASWDGESGEIGILRCRFRIPFRTTAADLTQ